MKKIIKYFSRIIIALALCTTAILGCKCNTIKSDPLAGFHWSDLDNLHTNTAIMDDYQGYIKSLNLEKNEEFIGAFEYYENGTGQHAVDTTIGVGGAWWHHVLIYDKDNKRIKVIKYRSGGYRS